MLDQEEDFLSLTHKVDFIYFGNIIFHAQILLSTCLVWLRPYNCFSKWASKKRIEYLVKHDSHALSKIHALKYKLLTCNIWKHQPWWKIKWIKKKGKRKICYQIKGVSCCVVEDPQFCPSTLTFILWGVTCTHHSHMAPLGPLLGLVGVRASCGLVYGPLWCVCGSFLRVIMAIFLVVHITL